MEKKLDHKYVVLEHLTLPDRGFRFWTTNSGDNTKLYNGKVVYKEILFTDNAEEAIAHSQKTNLDAIPTQRELLEYFRSESEKANREGLLLKKHGRSR